MPKKKKNRKVFVLDTSVILHDHNSINNFEENDVAIPITVLEELDNFKVGRDTKNFEAREAIRFIDKLSGESTLQDWVPLGEGRGRFRVVLDIEDEPMDAHTAFNHYKNDHKILNATLNLQRSEKDAKVTLVTKDVNLRIKAKSLSLSAEDYLTGKIKDTEKIHSTTPVIDGVESELLRKLFNQARIDETEVLGEAKRNNQYYILKNGKSSSLAYYNPFLDVVERVEKQYTYGIKPRNAEQAFALHAILSPEIKLVSLQGVAGTGKTLLALAGAIEQRNQFNQIILARPIVPLSNKDIGYLPGDAKEKINPYMEPLWDNLKLIKSQFKEGGKQFKAIKEMEDDGKIVITPLAFIRGRSFSNIIFIIDEAQNLTPHEVKTIITRAGENTKIIFTGDVHQIDTPYLDEQSNGLSYLIDRLKGHKLFAHVMLEKGERSELANLANDML